MTEGLPELIARLDAHIGMMEEQLENEKFVRQLKGVADDNDTPMPHVRVFASEIEDMRAQLAALREASRPQEVISKPQDTYHWGETMRQYAVLGIGAEAWVELEQAEDRGKRAAFAPTSGVTLNWRTFKLVMTVLRAIRLEDFREASRLASPPAPTEPQ